MIRASESPSLGSRLSQRLLELGPEALFQRQELLLAHPLLDVGKALFYARPVEPDLGRALGEGLEHRLGEARRCPSGRRHRGAPGG